MSAWQSVYDKSKNEYLGRTPGSWWKLLQFYAAFYTVLAAMFLVCMQGLISTLENDQPRLLLEDSLIGSNPGLGFRPMPSDTKEDYLIHYKRNSTSVEKYVRLIDEFLEPYRINQVGDNFDTCDFDKPPKYQHVCSVDVDNSFGPCNRQNKYGYNTGSPCIFLKLNRIYQWLPDYYLEPVEGMPQDLKEVVGVEQLKERIWVSCEGKGQVGQENAPRYVYYPGRGFPGYYYPYLNTRNYLSPLIAVQVVNPKPGTIVNVECRAWAKNIRYEAGNDRRGSVRFEILYDE